MNRTADIFESHRPRLFGIAYRMLGTRADAEDAVQDAYLRWHQAATEHVESSFGYLLTLTRRLCLDRLRELKQRRADYVELPLCEAVVDDHAPSPEAVLESKAELAAAFVKVLDRLSPTQCAAFFLHDVFDYDYYEVAQILCKSGQCCRQIIHRARAYLRDPHARFRLGTEAGKRSVEKFLVAVTTGDRRSVLSLLAEFDIAGFTESAVGADQPTVQAQTARNTVMRPADALLRACKHVTNAAAPTSL